MNTDTINAILHIRYGLKRMEKTCSTYEFPKDVLDSVTLSTKYQTKIVSPDKPSTSSTSSCGSQPQEEAEQDLLIPDF